MQNDSGLWVIRPFNMEFLVTFGAFLALLILASLLLRKKSEKTRQGVLVAACLVTFVGFFFYKYYLSVDAPYNQLIAERGGFNWWGELPLHLCNINMMLIPIAVLRKSRPMMAFGFFLAPLGAMMALAMPGVGFDGYSLLLPRMLGYYGTHFMIVIEGRAIVSFGLYRPSFRDLPRTLLTALLVTFGVFLINMLLRWTGLYPKANYFYSVETEGNPLLEIFHRWIPLPFLYLMPSVLILGSYMCLITGGFALADARRKKKEANS